MAERIFKEKFGNIKKIKVCTTSADIDFNSYTEPGTYEIYEDMGSGQSRVYMLTVDKSVTGACLKQTRIHCGKVDARQTTTSGAWTEWTAISGGGGGSADLSAYYTAEETDIAISNHLVPLENSIDDIYEEIGEIELALDAILTMQNELIGGAV